MSRIVGNLLTLARVDEGRLELLTTQVDLGEAIEAAVRPLRPLAAAKHLQLEVNGEHCEAHADPQRLNQALTNFIENAIKFSEPGGEVCVSAWERNGEVGVTVQDNGPGHSRRGAARTSSTASTAPTAARGARRQRQRPRLSICREIADAHGGRVWVESEEGEGQRLLPRPAWPARHARLTGLASGRGRSGSRGCSRRLLPKRRYSDGTMNRLTNVDVMSPPMITIAIGCSISWPGMLPPTISGTIASAVASAVIMIGESRSSAPRMTSAGPKGMPSCRSRCWQ